MEKANSGQNGDTATAGAQFQSKFDIREQEREFRIDDLTKESFEDLIPKKIVKLVEVEEETPETEQVELNDQVQVYSPHLRENPSPLVNFNSPLLPDFVKNTVKQMGFSVPTPIQKYSIPICLKGHDLISVAKTGSGKTFAYMIPCCIQLTKLKQKLMQSGNNMQRMMMMNNPLSCILAPTRELAIQIYNSVKMMTLLAGLKMCVIYGGADRYSQISALNRGCDVLIATPGRLIDFLKSGNINIGMVNYFVLDEADRMLDMGFFPQIREICAYLPQTRQSMFFSATWPAEVEKLSYEVCFNSPVKIKVGSEDLTLNNSITQHVEVLYDNEKRDRLFELFRQINDNKSKIIIFMRTKKSCDRLVRSLEYEGYRAVSLHGDKPQNQREYIINSFRNSQQNILVATDVASRGLDIKEIRYVINYDFPQGIEDYVHRIGRTGRAGCTGIAYTFINDADVLNARPLLDLLEKTNQKIPQKLLDLARCCDMKTKRRDSRYSSGGGYDDYSRSYNSYSKNQSGYGNSYQRTQTTQSNFNPQAMMSMMNNMMHMMGNKQSTGQQSQTTGYQAQTAGYQAQNAGYQSQNSGYQAQIPAVTQTETKPAVAPQNGNMMGQMFQMMQMIQKNAQPASQNQNQQNQHQNANYAGYGSQYARQSQGYCSNTNDYTNKNEVNPESSQNQKYQEAEKPKVQNYDSYQAYQSKPQFATTFEILSLESSGQKSQVLTDSPVSNQHALIESVSEKAPKFSGIMASQTEPVSPIAGFSHLITLPDIEIIDDTPPQTAKKNLHDNKILQSASTMPESAGEDKTRKTVLFPTEETIEVIEQLGQRSV